MARKPAKPEARHAARLAAVQALYQMDMAGTDLNGVIDEFTTYRFKQDQGEYGPHGPDATFFTELVRGVVRRQREIDPVVDQQLATGWRLVRVDSIIRAALRAAVLELIERPDVPARVVINEYINVAHAFFDDDGPKVVNGVLDRLARRYRPEEFSEKSGA